MWAERSSVSLIRRLTSGERVFIATGILLAVLILLLYLIRGDCMIVEGATYRSPQEVDNFFGGTMHPEVSFRNGQFSWVSTDTVTVGNYECKFGRLHAYTYYNSSEVPVHLDSFTGALWWYGEAYQRVRR